MSALPVNVTCIADAKASYGAEENQEPKGYIQFYRALLQRCPKLTAGEWCVLAAVLDRGASWGRYEPQKIKIEEFCAINGLTVQPIIDGITSLVARGVLYEERTGTSKTSATRYAIIDASNPEPGPYTALDGTLVINLLGGLVYPVNPVFLKSRKTGESNSKKQKNVILDCRKSNSKKQKNLTLQSRKTKSRQPAQEETPAQPQTLLQTVVIKQRRETISAASHEARTTNLPATPLQDTAMHVSSDSHQEEPTPASGQRGQRLSEGASTISTTLSATDETVVTTTLFEELPPAAELSGNKQAKQNGHKPAQGKGPRKPPEEWEYQNPLAKVWLAHAPRPSSAWEGVQFNDFLGQMLEAIPPVTEEELPWLITQYKTWDKQGRKLALTARAICNNLTTLRRDLTDPTVSVRLRKGAAQNGHAGPAANGARGDRGSGNVNAATHAALQRLKAKHEANQPAKAAE